MRASYPEKLESVRIRKPHDYGTSPGDRNGAFIMQGPCGAKLVIIAGAGGGMPGELGAWEHVSVSTEKRIPNWLEMDFVKNLFWDEEEGVMQFHPPRSRWVNCNPRCLHLWRPIDGQVRLPPMILVGPSGPWESAA